nr:hypothetical protein [Tanacetum cinerariifolium]
MAPYRAVRYWLGDFRRRRALKEDGTFSLTTQRNITIACFALQNFIRKEGLEDELFSTYDQLNVQLDNENVLVEDDEGVEEDQMKSLDAPLLLQTWFADEEVKPQKNKRNLKLARLLKSSKDLKNIIESQRSKKVKEGVGYNDVPPPAADLYLSPKKDLSWTGLPEFVDDIVTDYSRPTPTVESTSAEGQNKHSTTAENGESTDSILSKPAVKFVKAGDRPAERPTTNKAEFVKAAERQTTDKVETAKRPAVRYAEMYKRTSKRRRIQRETTRSQNHEYKSPSHRTYGAPMRPSHRPAGHRPHGPPMRPMRSNMNGARSKRTSAVRPQYRAPWVPTVNRNFLPINRKLPT